MQHLLLNANNTVDVIFSKKDFCDFLSQGLSYIHIKLVSLKLMNEISLLVDDPSRGRLFLVCVNWPLFNSRFCSTPYKVQTFHIFKVLAGSTLT